VRVDGSMHMIVKTLGSACLFLEILIEKEAHTEFQKG